MLFSVMLSMIASGCVALLAYASLAEAADGDPHLGCGEAIRAPVGSTVVVPVILHLGNTLEPQDQIVSVYKPGLPNNEQPWVMCMWKNSDDVHAPDICNKGSRLSRILDHTYRLMITIPTIRKIDSGNYNVSWTISSSQARIIKRCVSKLLVEEGKSPTTRQGPPLLGLHLKWANGVRHLRCGETIQVSEGSTVVAPVILHFRNTPAPEKHVVNVYKPGLPNDEHPWITCMWTNADELHAPDICNRGSRLSRILTHMYRLMIRFPTIRTEDSGNYIVSWMMSPDPSEITRTCVIKLLVQKGDREAESREASNVGTGVTSSTLTVRTVCVSITIGWFCFRN